MNQLSTRTVQLANQFGFSPLFIVIGGMWLLTMIAIPIAYSIYGEQSLTTLVTAGVFVQASVILSILQSSWGWTHTLRILLVIAILTWVAEFTGSQTGFPLWRVSLHSTVATTIEWCSTIDPLSLVYDAAMCVGGCPDYRIQMGEIELTITICRGRNHRHDRLGFVP